MLNNRKSCVGPFFISVEWVQVLMWSARYSHTNLIVERHGSKPLVHGRQV